MTSEPTSNAARPAADPTEAAVDAALARLDLPTKASLLAGQDVWSLPAVPDIGLASLVMSDGPIGVRGTRWTADDPSIALPSPTALAATWDPELAQRVGQLLAQEARRKGVHLLLAPTVNLHRSPRGGRHFEAYSEDPLLTSRIGVGYVAGVQSGGVGTTAKHYVANDSETERFTVDVVVSERALRELYLAPFEAIVRDADGWGVMTAYNKVGATTMTEHRRLVGDVLKGEWGFDGVNVSDWTAARDTVGAALGGLDVAMPGPQTVFGAALVRAVEDGKVPLTVVDEAVRRVLRLAARVGVLEGAPPAVPADLLPAPVDGAALAREVASRSFVLVHNTGVLPLDPQRLTRVAVTGAAAKEARVLGGGSAQVYPEHIMSPLEGLRRVLPVTYTIGADPRTKLAPAAEGFDLHAVFRDAEGTVLGTQALVDGEARWLGDLPEGVSFEAAATVEVAGEFTPDIDGRHEFGIAGVGEFRLTVDGTERFAGVQKPDSSDPGAALLHPPELRVEVDLPAGKPVPVSLTHTLAKAPDIPIAFVSFRFGHANPISGCGRPDRGGGCGRCRGRRRRRARGDDGRGRVGGLRQGVARATRRPGRTRAPRGRGQPPHRCGRERRLSGGDAVARRRGRGPAGVVPRPGGRCGAGRRPHRRRRTGRPTAHDLAGTRSRQSCAGRGPDRRRAALRRGRLHRLPRMAARRCRAGVLVRARTRLHRLGL